MTITKLGIIEPQQVKEITDHLNDNKNRLEADFSNYAKGRQKFWIQHQWDLKDRTFIKGHTDPWLWSICKEWMPDADLGLACYGPIGIKPHRDDSYADWRGVAINLGEIGSWSYNCEYPEFKWVGKTYRNPSDPEWTCPIPVGGVFEFNTKNLHGVNNPAKNRWAIFLWKVNPKFQAMFNAYTRSNA